MTPTKNPHTLCGGQVVKICFQAMLENLFPQNDIKIHPFPVGRF